MGVCDLDELLKMCMSQLAVTFSNSDLGLTWRGNTVCGVPASAPCVFSLYFRTIRLLRDTKSPIYNQRSNSPKKDDH